MAKIEVITNIAAFPQAFFFGGDDVTLQPGEIYRIPFHQQADAESLMATPHGKALVERRFLSIGADKTSNRTESQTPDMPEDLRTPVPAGDTGIIVGDTKGTKVKSAGKVAV